jgi:hypothetical protein
MTDKPDITGTLIVENRKTKLADGRVVVLVCGLMAFPEDVANEYCGDRPHQLVFTGTASSGLLRLAHVTGMTLEAGGSLDDADPDDRARWLKGYQSARIDQLITDQIWRL